MTAQHTQTPWKYEEEAQGTGGGLTRYLQTVKDADGNNIVRISAKNGEADCRRIVACVNACAGSSDEQLSLIGGLGGMNAAFVLRSKEVAELEQQRDDFQRELTKTQNRLNASAELYERALELKREAEQQRDELLDALEIISARLLGEGYEAYIDGEGSRPDVLAALHYMIVDLQEAEQQRDELQTEFLSLVRAIKSSSARGYIAADRLARAEAIAKHRGQQS